MKYLLLLLSIIISGCVSVRDYYPYCENEDKLTIEQKAARYQRRYYPKQKTSEMPKQKTVRYEDEEEYQEWKKYYRR